MKRNSLKTIEVKDAADKVKLINMICSLQKLPEEVVIKFLESKGAIGTLSEKSFYTAENE